MNMNIVQEEKVEIDSDDPTRVNVYYKVVCPRPLKSIKTKIRFKKTKTEFISEQLSKS